MSRHLRHELLAASFWLSFLVLQHLAGLQAHGLNTNSIADSQSKQPLSFLSHRGRRLLANNSYSYCTSTGALCAACDTNILSVDRCYTEDSLGSDSTICRLPSPSGVVSTSSICGNAASTYSIQSPDGGTAAAGELLVWRESGGQVLAVTLKFTCNWMMVAGAPITLTAHYGTGGNLAYSSFHTPTNKSTCYSFQVRLNRYQQCRHLEAARRVASSGPLNANGVRY
ncbi:hypothetical protein Vafri_10955 [Volvox africanus]|uniref:Pherophorin domain-containing protein n=1 Tax=Volvox africanus TaxID=51714 RepID=A0A8J4F179_9CHLO|nr:hypothetical protein Vafri_10955 [Volvox africanus]